MKSSLVFKSGGWANHRRSVEANHGLVLVDLLAMLGIKQGAAGTHLRRDSITRNSVKHPVPLPASAHRIILSRN